MLGSDPGDLFWVRCDKASARGAVRHGGESGPADSGAPERGDPSIEHHGWTIAGPVEIDRLEILVLLQSEAVQHVSRQDRKTRAARAECDRLTHEIANGLV